MTVVAVAALALSAAALAAPAKPRLKLGVHATVFEVDDPDEGEHSGQGDELASTGARFVRTQLSWFTVENGGVPYAALGNVTPSDYDWVASDARMLELAEEGVEAEPLTLIQSPAWAAEEDCPGRTTAPAPGCSPGPGHLDDWREFVNAAVSRYGPDGDFWERLRYPRRYQVRNFEIWNEPDAEGFWDPCDAGGKGCPGGPPDQGLSSDGEWRDYFGVLRAADRAAHAASPEARIVLGGVSYGGRPEGKALDWLPALLENTDAASHFDVVAVHPYSRRPREVVEKMLRVGRLPGVGEMFITELGWASTGVDKIVCARTEEGQAERLARTVELLRSEAPDVTRLVWFNAIDLDTLSGTGFSDGSDGQCPYDTHGLMEDGEHGHERKAAFFEFRRLASEGR